MLDYFGYDAEVYDDHTSPLLPDVPFYVGQARAAGSPVLELGCGTARVLIPVAEAGIEIVGLDRSPAMLKIAREKVARLPEETQARITLVEGDMREFVLDRQFSLVIIPFRAFLHLLTPDDQRASLTRIGDHLVEGGRLVFNNFDPNLEILAAHLGRLGGALTRHNEFTRRDTGRRVVVWVSRQLDLENQIIRETRIFEELDTQGSVVSRTFTPINIRWSHRFEMQYLLEACGFQVEALYGDFRGGPFRHGGEQVWVAKVERRANEERTKDKRTKGVRFTIRASK